MNQPLNCIEANTSRGRSCDCSGCSNSSRNISSSSNSRSNRSSREYWYPLVEVFIEVVEVIVNSLSSVSISKSLIWTTKKKKTRKMSWVKLGFCTPMLHHWATRTLYGERGPLRNSCVFVPRSWQDEKHLSLFLKRAQKFKLLKTIDLMVECSTIKPCCAPLYKNRQSTLKF